MGGPSKEDPGAFDREGQNDALDWGAPSAQLWSFPREVLLSLMAASLASRLGAGETAQAGSRVMVAGAPLLLRVRSSLATLELPPSPERVCACQVAAAAVCRTWGCFLRSPLGGRVCRAAI